MVHGFQGNHNDLKALKNQIALHNPDAQFLLSAANEGERTGDDIVLMGERLSKEVLKFIADYCPL